MNTFAKAFRNAFERMKEKGWDRIYVLVDMHGVVYAPDYGQTASKVYPQAIFPLIEMTKDPRIKLIMWTCSSERDIGRYREQLEGIGIKFDYVNSNPEVNHATATGDYTVKLYANVILDDKGGFEPDDWDAIMNWYAEEIQ